MKKIFLFVAAIAAMTVNAAEWDIAANPANTKALFDALNPIVTNATVTEETSSDSKQYIQAVNSAAGTEAVVEFDHFPMKLAYTHSSEANKKFFRIYPSYFQVDAKNTIVTISCNVGDEIKFYSQSYTKDLVFFITGGNKEFIEFKANAEAAVESVIATATEVVFDTHIPTDDAHKDWKQSYQFTKFEIVPASQAIDAVNADMKAVKMFENGQLVIIKNGVRYNALGVQL